MFTKTSDPHNYRTRQQSIQILYKSRNRTDIGRKYIRHLLPEIVYKTLFSKLKLSNSITNIHKNITTYLQWYVHQNFWSTLDSNQFQSHDDVIKWNHFPRYWPVVRGIHRSPVNSPHKGQWRRALMFSLICACKRLSKQSWGWCSETPSLSLWRHYIGRKCIRHLLPEIVNKTQSCITGKVSTHSFNDFHIYTHMISNYIRIIVT